MADDNDLSRRMQASFDEFQRLSSANQKISEAAYLNARIGLCS